MPRRRICAIKALFFRNSNNRTAFNTATIKSRVEEPFARSFCPIHGLCCPVPAFFCLSEGPQKTHCLAARLLPFVASNKL
jgi:hypothetical protein